MQISQIKNQNDKFVITTPVTAVVSEIKERRTINGNYGPSTTQSAKLTQGQDWIYAEFVNQDDITDAEGQTITMLSTEGKHGFNGVAVKKVEKGDRTFTNLRITAAANVNMGQPTGQAQAPVQQNQTQPPMQQPRPTPVQEVPASAIHGATVGMAIGRAIDVMGNVGMLSEESLGTKQFAKDLFAVASQIIRVSQAMESGRLAPKPEDQTTQPAPQPAPEPEPEPEPAPHVPHVEDDEDPF